MIQREIKKILFQNIFIPLAFGVSAAVFILAILHRINGGISEVLQSDRTIHEIAAVQKMITEAQSAARGYLLTRSVHLLTPFSIASNSVRGPLRQIESLTAKNELQLRRVRELVPIVEDWFSDYEDTLRKSIKSPEAAMSSLSGGVLETQATEIKRRLQEMTDEETRLKRERNANQENFLRYSAWLFIPLLLLGNSFVSFRGRRSILQISANYEAQIRENKIQMEILEKEHWIRKQESSLSDQLLKFDTLPEVADELVRFFSRSFGALAGAVFVKLDETCDQFSVVGAVGLSQVDRKSACFSAKGSLLDQVISQKKPVVFRDFSLSLWKLRSSLGDHVPQTILVVPLRYLGKCVAVLELAFNEEPEARLMDLMTAISEKLGGLVANEISKETLSRLYREVRDSQVKLEQQNTELEKANFILKNAKQDLEISQAKAVEADRYKSIFLANMSHEIRTPMTALIGFAELLLPRLKMDPQGRGFVEIILRNGNHLIELINEVLDLSKVEAGQLSLELSEFSIKQVVDDVLELLNPIARNNLVSVSLDLAKDLPDAFISDPKRLKQILTNVVGNAIKFSRGGKVHIEVTCTAAREVEISVSDTGIGIAPEKQIHLFQPFTELHDSSQCENTGTGLGLCLSKKLAVFLGGDLFLEHSEPGHGSTFVTRIPWLEMGESVVPVRPEKQEIDGELLKNVKVFVVDDSLDNQMLLEAVLSQYGARVSSTSDGETALELISNETTDIVLMDLKMPKVNGLETTRRLRGRGFVKPILLLTANAMKGERELARDAKAQGYISKPIDWNLLLNHMSALLGTDVARGQAEVS